MSVNALEKNQAISNYIAADKRVNITKTLSERKKMQESGLEGIDIRKTAKSLGKNDFLKLLVTQLTHQDPTQPLKDQQFIAQMAQFSSLEQMQNMSSGLKDLSNRQALSLVGKFIIGKDQNGTVQTGIAQALFVDDTGAAFLKIGKHAISINEIKLAGEPAAFKAEYGGTGANAQHGARRNSGNGMHKGPVHGNEIPPIAKPENPMKEIIVPDKGIKHGSMRFELHIPGSNDASGSMNFTSMRA